MKKEKIRAASVLLAVVVLLSMSSCSAVEPYDASNESEATGGYKVDSDFWNGDSVYEESDSLYADADYGTAGLEESIPLDEKIIYSAYVTVETTDFDSSVEYVYGMLEYYGAFLESSSISGRSYRDTYFGTSSLRNAYFVVRVPVESYKSMKVDLEGLGNILNLNEYTENITTKYTDTQSRLEASRIEQERLLAMLEEAETVTEMLEIESRLTDVRYELESLETTLRNWQNQVDYSTLNISLEEVEELTKVEVPHRSYWQQMGDGLKDSLEAVGDFFKDLFMGIVVALPEIVVAGVILALAAAIIVRSIRKHKLAKGKKTDETQPIEETQSGE